MIISGLQTGDTAWLAAHLQNAADNETVDIVEVSGTVATDIDGALAEFDAIASGTLAKEGVYAAFINPPEALSRLQYARALALIEERLGLEGQPRIVLFHEKMVASTAMLCGRASILSACAAFLRPAKASALRAGSCRRVWSRASTGASNGSRGCKI